MQADQTLYMPPPSVEELGSRGDVDGDFSRTWCWRWNTSTDVRARELRLHEAWGFPEVWGDVPDARSPSHPRFRPSGLTIHLLEGGRFQEAEGTSPAGRPGRSTWR